MVTKHRVEMDPKLWSENNAIMEHPQQHQLVRALLVLMNIFIYCQVGLLREAGQVCIPTQLISIHFIIHSCTQACKQGEECTVLASSGGIVF